ncbi:MAG: polymer-forming cytoskeletal protein [Bacillota bacterium]|nr:polymer-forming cytoskeletal protein [Bacillota bacterium]
MNRWVKVLLGIFLVGVVVVGALIGVTYWRRNVYVPEGWTKIRHGQTVAAVDQELGVIVEGRVTGGIRAPRAQVLGGEVAGGVKSTGEVVIGPFARVKGDVEGSVVRVQGAAQVYGDIRAAQFFMGTGISGVASRYISIYKGEGLPPLPLERFSLPGMLPTIYGDVTAEIGTVDGMVAGDVTLQRGLITARSVISGSIAESGNVIREKPTPAQGVASPAPATQMPKPQQPGGRIWVEGDKGIVRFPASGLPALPQLPDLPGVPRVITRAASAHRGFPMLLLPVLWLPMTLGAIALGGVAQVFAGKQMNAIWERVTAYPLRSIWQGVLAFLVTAIALVLLAVTIIGIPLAIALASACLLVYVIGYASVGWGIGRRLLQTGKYHPVIELSAGVIVLSLLLLLPVVGWFGLGLLAAMGYGAIVFLYIPSIMGRKAVA